MGKTFRKEKTFKPKKRRLNNHRDLPDFYEKSSEDMLGEEEYNAKAIRSQEFTDIPAESRKTPKEY